MTVTSPTDPDTLSPTKRLSQPEFIALVAMLFATIAFSIDAMLPAFPELTRELSPDAPNRVQLIVTTFVFGMGLGTLCTGPLSDSLGRKPLVLGGAALYIVSAAVAAVAQSLEVLLVARFLQGLGAAGPRVVALAMVRDQYSGRQMAKIISFVMMIFTLVPAIAPAMGAGIIWLAGWRGIFLAFMLFSIIGATWMAIRQPETLPPSTRRPFRMKLLVLGIREILNHPVSARAIAVQCFCFAPLFVTLSTTQQIFDHTFDSAATFPFWYAMIALLAGSSSVLNAVLVERLGMRFLVRTMLAAQVVLTGGYCISILFLTLGGTISFVLYLAWLVALFFQAGMTIGNLNALALEPMGHMAGLAASVTGAISTVVSVMLAVPIGLLFDGTPLYPATGIMVLVTVALLLMEKLYRSVETAPAT